MPLIKHNESLGSPYTFPDFFLIRINALRVSYEHGQGFFAQKCSPTPFASLSCNPDVDPNEQVHFAFIQGYICKHFGLKHTTRRTQVVTEASECECSPSAPILTISGDAICPFLSSLKI
ncbi:hypothetical protein KZX70_09650 [Paenibacillus silvae]|nr:hypothetical protein [Paenibacillus silvae]